jgi:endogenous inhibitor of DNA gyrase (YacG/DUF329 family)
MALRRTDAKGGIKSLDRRELGTAMDASQRFFITKWNFQAGGKWASRRTCLCPRRRRIEVVSAAPRIVVSMLFVASLAFCAALSCDHMSIERGGRCWSHLGLFICRYANMTESAQPRQLSMLLVQSARCAVCGEPFEITRRRGRPQLFCSAACRRIQHRAQIASWAQKQKRDVDEL